MYGLDTCAFILLYIQCALGATTWTTSTKTTPDNPTCPYRTINYLTHTLAQQCLPSSRAGGAYWNTTTNNSTITRPTSQSKAAKTSDPTQASEAILFTESPDSSVVESTSKTKSGASSLSHTTTSIESVTTIVPSTILSSSTVPVSVESVDDESSLEGGNFLSFEEWKKHNLIKAGQSEHLGRDGRGKQREPRKRQENVHNTLDSLGDDAEIELDFAGLVPAGLDTASDYSSKNVNHDGGAQAGEGAGSKLETKARSKDAGTTCKERFNYASYDCAANVLKSNSEAKSANQVLRENKDMYMLNKCSASNKFIILELCEDISIDTIALANFEFFSSSFRTFRVSVSDRYPVKIDKWKTLGTFEARNTREVQAFLIENPVIWARYVRVEFLTHYGHEFYCPVSLIRVHGTTMMEEYKHDPEMRSDDDDEDEIENSTAVDNLEDKLIPEAVDESLLIEQHAHIVAKLGANQAVPILTDAVGDPSVDTTATIVSPSSEDATTPNEGSSVEDVLLQVDVETCASSGRPQDCLHNIRNESELIHSRTAKQIEISSPVYVAQSTANSPPVEEDISSSSPTASHSPSIRSSHVQKEAHNNTNNSHSSGDGKKSTNAGTESAKGNSTVRDMTRTHAAKQPGSVTQSQPASPTMPESFFKSVQKRLQMLESNSSLSLQYIEEQSRALRDAFRKVEHRQLSRTSHFLENLNQTVLNELREFRQQYDQLWQSTVIELELQREMYQQESQAMHARLGVLADELIFQRRVSMLQMVLVLVCLGLILFSRGALNNYLELPLVQSVLSRSPSSKWINTSGGSRNASPAILRTRSAHQLGLKQGILKSHRRGVSDESGNEPLSGSEMYSPPTPVSFDEYSDVEIVKPDLKIEDPAFDPISIERPSTSPPMLSGMEDPTTPRMITPSNDMSIDGRLSIADTEYLMDSELDHSSPLGRHLTWDLPESEMSQDV